MVFTELSVKLMLRNQAYLNNSIVAFNDIGEGDNALLCGTDKPDCCKPPKGPLQGEFYYPNNTLVRNNASGDSLYRNRGPQVIRLNRRNDVLSPTGRYRCEIPDSSGMNRNIFISITGLHEFIHNFDYIIYNKKIPSNRLGLMDASIYTKSVHMHINFTFKYKFKYVMLTYKAQCFDFWHHQCNYYK